jgi:hypothetical protein
MDVFQITKIVVDRRKNIKIENRIEMETVPGPAYIHIEDAWAQIGKLVDKEIRKCIQAIQVYSLFSGTQVDFIKAVQEHITISINKISVTISVDNGTKEVTYAITKLEIV